jgi:hypothetical protein
MPTRRRLRELISAQERATVFTEAAATATNTGLAYWLVLSLTGAIAALGLALAVGDGQLAVEVSFIMLLSTLGVILVGSSTSPLFLVAA